MNTAGSLDLGIGDAIRLSLSFFSKLTENSSQAVVASRTSRFRSPIQFEARMAIALVALGAILMVTNPWFTAVDDEVVILDVAARPALQTIKLFLGGSGQHEHPPLSDLVLHGWLWLTNGNLHLLRLPSVVFYLLGIWFLVQAARRIGGDRAGYCTLTLLLLWPNGFHYGRIAGWYAFTFMLVSLLTLTDVKYLEDQSLVTWTRCLEFAP
jgi:Dolichyl-phosphate-mannose-protein mannosyltransferase